MLSRCAAKLGDVLEFRNDIVHPYERPTGEATFVGLEHIEKDTGVRIGSETIRLEEMTGRRARFQKNNIVYGYLRPYLNKVWIAEFDGLCSVDQYVFSVRPKADLKYVAYYLRSDQFLTTAPITGSPGQLPRIRSGEIADTPIPLPPLAEQRRIAAILDAADALRQKRRQALRLLNQLTQAIFVEMFGDPVRNERSWPVATVADFVAGFEAGKNLVADDEDDDAAPYRVLKVSAVTSLSYRADESKPLPRDYDPPASHIVRPGDLLFSRANTAQLIGATALVTETPDNCVLPDKIWRFVWHDRPRADPYFAWYLFQQRRFRNEVSRRATGTSGSMKNISQEKVLSVPVALPPLRLQKQFGARASLVSRQRRTYDAAIAKQDRLFASLQHRAFRGQL
jgi:type I restriction enzyme S subunit